MKNSSRGSVISTVMISTVVVAILVASIASLITTQRRINTSRELQLQAIAVAEAAADYIFSFTANEVDAKGLEAAPSVPDSGSAAVTLPSDAQVFLRGLSHIPGGVDNSVNPTFSDIQVRLAEPRDTTRYFLDPKNPRYMNDPNVNQWIWDSTIPLVAKTTATRSGRSVTAYVKKDICIREIPLFQYAIFFQGQLQLHRGYRPLGDIHSNGPLLINAHNDDTAKYTGYITSHAKIYRGSTIDQGGTGADGYGYTRVKTDGDLDFSGGVSPVATGDTRISLNTNSSDEPEAYASLRSGFDSRTKDWKEKSMQLFKGHLRDASHEVQNMKPVGSAGYRLDAASTYSTNEFTNGPYSLIEPLLPTTHAARKSTDGNRFKLAANAGLILRVEAKDRSTWPDLYGKNGVKLAKSGGGGTYYTDADLKKARNITDVMVVKAYKYKNGPPRGANVDPELVPVTLPTKAIGKADTSSTTKWRVQSNTPSFEPYTAVADGTLTYKINSGLHNSRLGRGADLLTIDMEELKRVMEAVPSTLSGNDAAFRSEFLVQNGSDPSVTPSNADWNGVIYVEFPTSLNVKTTDANTKNGITSYAFEYGSPELRHPDRASESDSRANRGDKIVPIAPELRRYPDSTTDADIANRYWAVPALQLINATKLPNPLNSPGVTIATNGPLYIVGSYNSDGDYTTGTNVTSGAPDAWADPDVGEVSAALYSDTLTFLSDEWITDGHRTKSFPGSGSASGTYRKVALDGTKRIEIGACIATGEYPIFEFFTNALENFQTIYDTKINPIIIKGSMIGMFHSEIQHVKTAYGRQASKDIQVYYAGHGAFAIPTVRYHQYLVDGIFPPGTPVARTPIQQGFRILHPGNPEDAAVISAAGF